LADNAALVQKVEALLTVVGTTKWRIASYRAQANDFRSMTLKADETERLRRLSTTINKHVGAF
jgi:phage gp16-like protein